MMKPGDRVMVPAISHVRRGVVHPQPQRIGYLAMMLGEKAVVCFDNGSGVYRLTDLKPWAAKTLSQGVK